MATVNLEVTRYCHKKINYAENQKRFLEMKTNPMYQVILNPNAPQKVCFTHTHAKKRNQKKNNNKRNVNPTGEPRPRQLWDFVKQCKLSKFYRRCPRKLFKWNSLRLGRTRTSSIRKNKKANINKGNLVSSKRVNEIPQVQPFYKIPPEGAIILSKHVFVGVYGR